MGRISRLLYPETALDTVITITLFLTLGIWLVIQRYKTIRDRAVLFYWPAPLEADQDFQSKFLDNPSLDAHLSDASLLPHGAARDRKYITSYDPATGLHLKTFMADSARDIETKIANAAAAQEEWAFSTFADRKRVMKSLKRWLVENQEVCARVAARDSGKTFLDAGLGEILTTAAKLDWLLDHGARVLKPETRYSSLLTIYKHAEVHFEPLGVVAALVSWNYPLHNAWSPIIAALFTGNAVVLKCSEHVIWSTLWFVGAIKECLRACRFNPELIQVVCCLPSEAEVLTKSTVIKHITFIGSEEVGRKVALAAAHNMTPLTLELGGKDPAIILPGTDLDRYISIWMRGIFQNAGQNCVGIEKLIVHQTQYEELYDTILRRTKELRSGPVLAPPVEGFETYADVGAMISRDRFRDLQRVLDEAEHNGATIDTGGKPYLHPYFGSGSYFYPTVVGNPPTDSLVAQLELFAPIALIQSYETVEEAIELANGTKYGLGASVFGPDETYAIQVAKQIKCGMVSINDYAVFYLNQDLPFGGTKASGYGRFSGPEGLRSLTNPKAIISDRLPWLIQTSIPRVVDYPIPSLVQSWEFVSGMVAFFFADGYRARGRGLVKLVNAARTNVIR